MKFYCKEVVFFFAVPVAFGCSFSRLVWRCREVSFVSCALPGFKPNTL